MSNQIQREGAEARRLDHNFQYHPPSVGSGAAHARVRLKARELAELIEELVPQNAGREKAIALTNVEQAMMWACAGIVRHPNPNAGETPALPGEKQK